MDAISDEIKRAQDCVNDLISIMAVQAVWSGRESAQIVGTLLEALIAILRLDFAYAWLNGPDGGAPIEVVRLGRLLNLTVSQQEIAQLVKCWLESDQRKFPSHERRRIGSEEFSIEPLRLGRRGEVGALVAGSRR
jgi:hypothetical protein